MFEFWMLLLIWLTTAGTNFKVFFKTNIYEPIMLSVWSRHQNKEIFVCFNVGCLCFFDKPFLIWISWVLRNQLCIYEPLIKRMLIAYWGLQNRDIYLCLNVDCLFLFQKLLLTWNSKFFMEATISDPTMRLVLIV